MYSNIKLIYISPPGLELPSDIVHEITGKGTIEQVTGANLEMVSPSYVLWLFAILLNRPLLSRMFYTLQEFRRRDSVTKKNSRVQ
jgi:hypothetical protein